MARLFRDEVIARRASAVFGGVSLAQAAGRPWPALLAALCAVALAATLWNGTYTRRERVAGVVAPAAGVVTVRAPRAGTLTTLAVADGDAVAANQPLFTVAPAGGTTAGADAAALQVDALLRERHAVAAQITDERSLADAAADDALRRARGVRDELGAAGAQRTLASRRAALLAADVERVTALADAGHVPRALLDARLADLFEARRVEHALERDIIRLRADADALAADARRAPAVADTRIAALHARALALEREIGAADLHRSTVVRAPLAGTVTAVAAVPGDAVWAERVVLALVPRGSRLRAELVVPPHAAGFIEPGQRVRIRYDPFPHPRFGVHGATVREVSRTALPPDEQPAAVRLPMPAYRVVADLDAQTVSAHGRRLPLRAGFTLQADVLRERRRLADWLFEPLLARLRAP